MKNVKQVAERTNNIISRDRSTWITLYYSIQDDAVYAEPINGTHKVCDLLNPNTEQDIIDTIEWWKRL